MKPTITITEYIISLVCLVLFFIGTIAIAEIDNAKKAARIASNWQMNYPVAIWAGGRLLSDPNGIVLVKHVLPMTKRDEIIYIDLKINGLPEPVRVGFRYEMSYRVDLKSFKRGDDE